MYFTHLECSEPCGAGPFDGHERHHVCPSCGMPLLARYDLARARTWSRDSLTARPPTMWRYREMLPLFPGETAVTLGEGFTPLLRTCRLGDAVGLERLYIKDESFNPTNSFKARGQSAAAAYAAAAGLQCEVFMPRDAKTPFVDECRLYGANITLVDGLITDAGKMAAAGAREHGWYDVSTLKEPYRVEGKKTMGYEVAEQLGWTLPDWIIYPTGGGTGMVGMWKAFDELEALGWIGPARPRMVTVQPTGCAPMVRAFTEGTARAALWEAPDTEAHGLRVPKAIGDFLVLRAIRASGGTALAVTDDEMIDDMLVIGRLEGISAAPEGAAALSATRRLVASGVIQAHESVVLFNTGGALKYLDVLHARR